MSVRILVVDDDPLICEQLTALYRKEGYEVTALRDPGQALDTLATGGFSLAVLDMKMPGVDGIELMEKLCARQPSLDVIMITGHASIRKAVDAMKRGASNYITKPFETDEMLLATEQVLARRKLLDENAYLRQQLQERYSFAHMVSRNPVMLDLFATLEMLAQHDATVLITGESGTGKELVARAIHFQGKRRGGRFVAINCAALPENLLESELFGFERGAFTGATQERIGKIEWANGGTLFLDEIESIPLAMQLKLLRVLEEREIERLGGNRRIPIDMRVVAASNRDMAAAVRSGLIREDFYYRINVMRLRIPPLRERLEDLPLLVGHFLGTNDLARQKGIVAADDRALAQLAEYNWPGNVRELQNVLERALLRTAGDKIVEVDLGDAPTLRAPQAGPTAAPVPLREYLRAAEREYLARLLERFDGGIGQCARHAAIDQATLHRKIKTHGLRPSEFRSRGDSAARRGAA